jgi:hypothetical protein
MQAEMRNIRGAGEMVNGEWGGVLWIGAID